MAKYSKKLVDKICDFIRSDSYTISEICKITNISRRTFYTWMESKPEFKEQVEKAQEEFEETCIVAAERSLMRLVKGYIIEEKRIVTADTGKKDDDGKPIVRVKEHIVTEKHIQPSTTAIIFTLSNRDPSNWKNRQSNDVTGVVSIKSELESMTDEELQEIIDEE